jgi:hypothetical protein
MSTNLDCGIAAAVALVELVRRVQPPEPAPLALPGQHVFVERAAQAAAWDATWVSGRTNLWDDRRILPGTPRFYIQIQLTYSRSSTYQAGRQEIAIDLPAESGLDSAHIHAPIARQGSGCGSLAPIHAQPTKLIRWKALAGSA